MYISHFSIKDDLLDRISSVSPYRRVGLQRYPRRTHFRPTRTKHKYSEFGRHNRKRLQNADCEGERLSESALDRIMSTAGARNSLPVNQAARRAAQVKKAKTVTGKLSSRQKGIERTNRVISYHLSVLPPFGPRL